MDALFEWKARGPGSVFANFLVPSAKRKFALATPALCPFKVLLFFALLTCIPLPE